MPVICVQSMLRPSELDAKDRRQRKMFIRDSLEVDHKHRMLLVIGAQAMLCRMTGTTVLNTQTRALVVKKKHKRRPTNRIENVLIQSNVH